MKEIALDNGSRTKAFFKEADIHFPSVSFKGWRLRKAEWVLYESSRLMAEIKTDMAATISFYVAALLEGPINWNLSEPSQMDQNDCYYNFFSHFCKHG